MSPVGLPELIGGKYRPRGIVGAGSTGIVYAVEHALTGEVLALKVMTSHLAGSADAVARFKREARAVSRIKSEHVVRIFDADVAAELGGAPFLVMDLLEGTDLEKLTGDRPMPADAVVGWLRQAAIPLDKAHRLGIVHRDLKPENLFLARRDDGCSIIKVLDFGIARMAAESVSVGGTQWGQLLGTPLYMAPEQARGDPSHIVPTTDLFALGLTTYRLLTGSHYRMAVTWEGMLEEILRGPLQAPSARGKNFGADFDTWFLRACSMEAALRFESAREQIEALARALGLPHDMGSSERTSGPPSPLFYSPDPRQAYSERGRGSDGTPVPPISVSPISFSPAPFSPTPISPMGHSETMVASASELRKSDRGEPIMRHRRRLLLIPGLLLPLGVLIALLVRRTPDASTAAVSTASGAHAAGDSPVPAPTVLPSPSAPPMAPAASAAAAATPPASTTAPAQLAGRAPTTPRREVPLRRETATRAEARPRPIPMDDPLGDQK